MKDLALYLVTDHRLDFQLLYSKVEEALKAGITRLQYRNKYADTGILYRESLALKDLCNHYQVPLIINDRVDIALVIDAHGVHLGQKDLPLTCARQLLGPDKIIGVSVHNQKEAFLAQRDGADYLSLGALFHTSSKANTRPMSLLLVEEIGESCHLPLYGIGGITPDRLTDQHIHLLDGVAVITALLHTDQVTATVEAFKTLNERKKVIR